MKQAFYRHLLWATLVLAVVVVTLGAYVRLSDAGLGCPDWPGCYGKLLGVPQPGHEVTAAEQAYPHAPVEAPKAWKEMIHRYAAGTLGLLIAALAFGSWWQPRERYPIAETLLLGLVLMQAMLGMWTVTQLLKPVIVTLHLLGGMGILAFLVYLLMRDWDAERFARVRRDLPTKAWGVVLLIFCQIALGGWVSSNYAAMVCTELLQCQGSIWPVMDGGHAFTLNRALGQTASGAGLPLAALTAIHWTHRLFAVVVAGAVLALGVRLLRTTGWQLYGWLLICALIVQWCLGLSNVWWQWPLFLAVLHNTGAAFLLLTAVATATRLSTAKQI